MAEKIIKNTATAIVLLICAIFVVRCIMVADKSEFDKPMPTEALSAAFADGEIAMQTVEMAKEIADDGYFTAYAFYYTPESGEVQLTVRWNDSVYEYTDMEAGHEFAFHFVNETTGAVYPATTVETKDKTIYNYRRILAEGVELGDDDQFIVVMELRDGYTSTFPIKYAEQKLEDYTLPSSVKKALTEAK